MEQSARYVYKVFLEQSITKAAEKLFISQPALSAAIARHEKELGFQIFNRATLPLSLTPKGHIYIESLSQILAIEEEMTLRIRESSAQDFHQITIGCTNTIAYYILPEICKEFSREHPGVKITVDLGNNANMDGLPQKFLHNKIDFFISGSKPNIKCKTIQLLCDPILVAISNTIEIPDSLRQFAITYDELLKGACDRRVTHCSDFKNIPFINYYPGTPMFKKMHKILGDYQSVPINIINAKNAIFHYQLAKQGVGAVFMAVTAAKKMFTREDDISFFLLEHEYAKQEIYICYNADSKHIPVMQDFLNVCQRICQKNNP